MTEFERRVRGLLQAMVDGDPDDGAADAVTCWMVWQKEAADLLAMPAGEIVQDAVFIRPPRPARPRGAHVHHIDGDPYNNDPANLRIVPARK
jgi:hypothetical protein